MSSSEKCSNCRFFRRLAEKPFGRCCYNPPVKSTTPDLRDGFPMTEENSWCRLHEPGEPGTIAVQPRNQLRSTLRAKR